jgi:hypothetical protein
MSWDAQHFHVQQLAVHQALKWACIDVMYVCKQHWKWSMPHNASSIDDVLCCFPNVHQSKYPYVSSDEAVIGEMECTACFLIKKMYYRSTLSMH